MVAGKLFTLSENPDYEQPPEQSIGAKAERRGVSVWEELFDTVIARDGRELIYLPIYNYTELSYDNVLTMMQHPLAIPGLSDGGAHVGTVCDASFPSYLLSYWTRDRTRGPRIAPERAVQMLTADIADYLGLSDRGRIKPGLKADLNVIDYQTLGLHPPRLVKDLPAGGIVDGTGGASRAHRLQLAASARVAGSDRPHRLQLEECSMSGRMIEMIQLHF